MQITHTSKPWYTYPLVWMMISIPVSAIVMGVIMIWLAVDTNDGLVADDYYKQGLAINEVISRDKRAAELGLSANLNFDANGNVFQLRFEKGQLEAYPEQFTLHLQHATRADSDIFITLNRGIGNQYIGNSTEPVNKGVWYFELANEEWKLSARSHVKKTNELQLISGY